MPLFGPNINKMAQKRDISGLLKITRDGSPNDRIKAIEAIADLGDTDALEQALENLSVSTMFGIWDRVISSVTRLPSVDAATVFAGLLVSDIEADLQEKVLEALLDLGALEDAELWSEIGATLTEKNRIGIALHCFDQALKIEPANKELTGSIAGALFDKRLFDDALKYFQRFSQLDSSDERGWGYQGLCLANLERLEEAKVACMKALEIKPSYTPVRDALVGIYYQLGDYEGRASVARENLDLDPSNVKAHLMLSEALAFTDKLADAETHAQKALEHLYAADYADPESLAIIYQQIGILSVMRGHEGALEYFEKAIKANQRDQWMYKMADACVILGMNGILMEGTPRERRARLLDYAEQRR